MSVRKNFILRKFIAGFAVIIAIVVTILAFFPLLQSPLAKLGWMTILIVSIPGILTIASTIVSLYNRFFSSIMFLILACVFLYLILIGSLEKNYYSLCGFYFVESLLLLFSARKRKQNYLEESTISN